MHHFTWFGWLSHHKIDHHNIHMFTAGLVALVLVVLALLAFPKLRKTEERAIPSSRFSLVNIFELAVENLLGLIEGIVGPQQAKRYLPLIGSIFIYVFLCNAISLIPGFLPPTDNINTNLAVSVTVFLYYNWVGIRTQGLRGYINHFLGPILWLGPLMLVIEIIGHVVRPVSLSLRLFGNITGDHLVLGIFSDLVPLLVPVLFLALGLFVSFIQAFVFSLLSTIYIGLATEHHDAHGDHAAHKH